MTQPTGRKAPSTISLVFNFDDATWGDLRQLVDLCEDIPDDQAIEYEQHPVEDLLVLGIRATLPRER